MIVADFRQLFFPMKKFVLLKDILTFAPAKQKAMPL
jgi:hypothetical protein